MKNSTIQRVIILGTIAIIGILSVQSFWLFRTWDFAQQQFQEKVIISLINTAKDLAKLKNMTLTEQDLVTPVSSDYYVVNFNDKINASDLEYYLAKNLVSTGLQEDFEYGIYDCYSKAMVYGNYVTFNTGDTSNVIASVLPTYEKSPYNFGVRFPKKNSFMLGSMKVTIIFTGILLLAILFFLYSMFVILQQKRMSEMQKDFINNMTHEFKTPISTIKIAAEVFVNNDTIRHDSRLLKYASIIKEQNQRLNNQVEKVLQITKIEKETLQLSLERLDLHELVQHVFESCEMKVLDMKGTLQLNLNAKNPIIQADHLHLTNILHNLVDNAMKYHKGNPEITISTRDAGRNKLVLTIEDKGIGISKEYQQKVFQKFFRIPTGDVHNVKGFGLGLYYVKNICDAHQWQLTLDSDPNQYTRVNIEMPKSA